jgi:hypothetical protein
MAVKMACSSVKVLGQQTVHCWGHLMACHWGTYLETRLVKTSEKNLVHELVPMTERQTVK